MSSDSTIIIEVEKKVLAVDMPMQTTIQIDFPERITINNSNDPSPSIEAVIEEYEAANSINVNRAVALLPDGRIVHADKDTPMHNLDVIGVSKTSGAVGQLVTVVKFGKLTGASFGPVSSNFFLGNNGQLLSSAPTNGNWLSIGIQETLSEFFVNIGESIVL